MCGLLLKKCDLWVDTMQHCAYILGMENATEDTEMNGTFVWTDDSGRETEESLDQRPRRYKGDPEWDDHTPEQRAKALLQFFNDTLRPHEKVRHFVRANAGLEEVEEEIEEKTAGVDFLPALDFFRPNDNFTAWLDDAIHIRYNPVFEIGAGCGLALKHMQDCGINSTGLDILNREERHTLVQVASQEIIHEVLKKASSNMVMMICRPCHSGFAQDYFKLHLKFHGRFFAYYIGLEKNVEDDLHDMSYEKVAENVGEDGENIYQVFCTKKDAKNLYTLTTRGGVYEFDEKKDEFVSTDEHWIIPKGMRVPSNRTDVRECFLGYRYICQRPRKLKDIAGDYDCGWIDHEGRTYKIPYTSHSDFIYQWLFIDETKDTDGWIKVWPESVNDLGVRFCRNGDDFEPSNDQIRALSREFGIKYERERVGDFRTAKRSSGKY